ncbi:MAG: membrane dipeptidase [Alphaproteobacteria bacterium]|nr:membrane dipeptidase [Alphaproteobacteria bacterium]
MAIDAEKLHREAIVIDAVCPLLSGQKYTDWYIEGGVTIAAPSVGAIEGITPTMRSIAAWKSFIQRNSGNAGRVTQVSSVKEMRQAKKDGRFGLYFHFQGTDPMEDDLDMVHAYKDLGVGIMQLCYNVRNRVGDGADERQDTGLSYFGVEMVKKLNEARVIVDVAHTGIKTSFDALEVSERPVICSHGNPRAVKNSHRNLPDDLMKAIAAQGGVIGMVGFPAFVADSPAPTLDQFIDHIAYTSDLVGIDHVGLGIDYYSGQYMVMPDDQAKTFYDSWIASGKWRPGTYPPPPHKYPQGIETPRTLQNLTKRMIERGFSAEDTRKVLGENWMRVYEQVWGA